MKEERGIGLQALVETVAKERDGFQAKLKEAERALEVAQITMMSKGWWENEAGYLTDAALWIDKAQNAIRQTGGMG